MYGWNLRENNIRYKKIIDKFIEKDLFDNKIDDAAINDDDKKI